MILSDRSISVAYRKFYDSSEVLAGHHSNLTVQQILQK
jgi:hypothetical protein